MNSEDRLCAKAGFEKVSGGQQCSSGVNDSCDEVILRKEKLVQKKLDRREECVAT